MFEIVLNVTIHEGSLVFPEDLHDCRQAIVASTPEVQVSLRLHDYFMGTSDPSDPKSRDESLTSPRCCCLVMSAQRSYLRFSRSRSSR